MIPRQNITDIQVRMEPSLTWRVDTDLHRIDGSADDLDAVAQMVYITLNVERYEHELYPWGYGVELADLIGRPRDLVIPEIRRRITEALTVDDRVTGVTDFTFTPSREAVAVAFTVNTIFGDIQAEREVSI